MVGKEEILLSNIQEYFSSAEQSLREKRYNVAATLFFKAICAAIDLFLFQKEGVVPSSHTDRFRIVQQKYPEIYDLLDRDFPFYQNSYSQKMSLEAVEVLKEDAQKITARIKRREKR
ncbi:MAG TPA: hypothetical protein VJA23_04160 [Candidatus Nanoarchaeia archaeon]|nr:hypothetical protein [Candidatus Nanoarchaeia archaeon]